VQFKDGTVVLATIAVSGGTAAFSTSSLAQGTHPIQAVYSGSSNHNGSQSSVLSLKVKP
jgi:hypothetical protein